MRKGQVRILQSAEKREYPEAFIRMLSDESKTLKELEALDRVLFWCRKSPEIAVSEDWAEALSVFAEDGRSLPYLRDSSDGIFRPDVDGFRDCWREALRRFPKKSSFYERASFFRKVMLVREETGLSAQSAVAAADELDEAGTSFSFPVLRFCAKTEGMPERMGYLRAQADFETSEPSGQDGFSVEDDVPFLNPFPFYPPTFVSDAALDACRLGIPAEEFARRRNDPEWTSSLPKLGKRLSNPFLHAAFSKASKLSSGFTADAETEKALRKASEFLPNGVRAFADVPFFDVEFHEGSSSWEVRFESYSQTAFGSDGTRGAGRRNETVLVFFEEGVPYLKKDGRLIPASLRVLERICRNEAFREILLSLLGAAWERNYAEGAVRSAVAELSKESVCPMLPPTSIKDLIGRKSLNEAMRPLYRRASNLNWNRAGIRLGYAVCKALPFVDEGSRRKLIQAANDGTLSRIVERQSSVWDWKRLDSWEEFLVMAALRASVEDSLPTDREMEDSAFVIMDVVRMARRTKRKISLRGRSWRKLLDLHDELVVAVGNENLHRIRKRKRSRFDNLRKVLPKDGFEWLRTTGRMKAEGDAMHHCVASYCGDVDADRCAIYSFFLDDGYLKDGKPTRYTAEFVISGSGGNERYAVRQIQARADRGASDEARSLLRNYAEKAGRPNSVTDPGFS